MAHFYLALYINTKTDDGQLYPCITGLVNGGFVVGWEDASSTQANLSSGSSITAHVFAAAFATNHTNQIDS